MSICYDMGVFTVQLLLSTLAGVGSAMEAGSADANALVYTVLASQLSVALWLACGRPSNDRIDNLNAQLSWLIECSSTAMLILAARMPSLAALRLLALLVAMMSTALPLLVMLYDSVLLPVVGMVSRCFRCCRTIRRSVRQRRSERSRSRGGAIDAGEVSSIGEESTQDTSPRGYPRAPTADSIERV